MAEGDPTYLDTTWSGLPLQLCLLCEHQDFDMEVFTRHMASFHDGIMLPASPGPGPETATPAALDAPQEPAGSAAEATTADSEASPDTPAPAAEGV